MPEGRIVKALSGYYYVDVGDRVWQCRARGLFKKKQFSPLVGDWVDFDATENGEGYIQKVFHRTSELIRPPVANVDQAVVVNSVRQPDLSPRLIDKFLVHSERVGLKSIIVLTKSDLAKGADDIREVIAMYESVGYPVNKLSAKTGEGLNSIRERLRGQISVFAGQSGVGKSTLLNALVPGVSFETGDVSHKLGRGRHTTRHVEMVRFPQGGWIVDTPGFSQLSFRGWSEGELSNCFPEVKRLSVECKYRGCLHDREPQCAVKEAVQSKAIHKARYKHYLEFLHEIESERRY